jgi:signal transduction histidine kinase
MAQLEVAHINTQLEARVAQRTAELQQVNQDLSEALYVLKIAQKRLVHAEKLSALGALVAGVAHELNTPIGNSLTMASTLEEKAQAFEHALETGLRRSDVQNFAADIRAAADLMVRNLSRAGSIVDSFKQVAVVKSQADHREFSLADLVRRVVATRIAFLHTGQPRVFVDIPHDLTLYGQPDSVAQVFGQLLDNAIVHGFEPGQLGRVDIRVRKLGGDRLMVVVSDDGCGVDPDKLNHVFEPFYTTRFGQGGSGLGLYIVHDIVTGVLDGDIQIHSQVGQGTQVVLNFPLAAP